MGTGSTISPPDERIGHAKSCDSSANTLLQKSFRASAGIFTTLGYNS